MLDDHVFIVRPRVTCPFCGTTAPLGRWRGVMQQQRAAVTEFDGTRRQRMLCLTCRCSFVLVEETDEEVCHCSGSGGTDAW